jgi:hypothetical protein
VDDRGIDPRWRTAVAAVALLALLAALVVTPRSVRRRRRQRRLGAGPEPVWDELRDTILDLGLGWPSGRSPRETGAHVRRYLGPVTDADDHAERALQLIVSAVEQHRYARPGRPVLAVDLEAGTVLTSVEAGATRGARRRAEWLPRSLLVPARAPVGRRRRREALTRGIGVTTTSR